MQAQPGPPRWRRPPRRAEPVSVPHSAFLSTMPSVTQPDFTVHYERAGNGPPLLLIHGTGGDGRSSWAGLAPKLGDQRTLLMPSYSGSNGAWDAGIDAGAPLTVELLARQVGAVADDAAADGTIDVIGFSLGAVVAAAYAAREPGRIRRLVLLAGWPTSADARLQLGIRLWLHLHQTDPDAFVRLATTLAFSPAYISGIGEAGVTELLRWQPSAGIRRQLELDLIVDLTAELPKITAPTLVIGCRQDQLVPVDNARALHRAIAGSRYLEIDSGHMAGIEQPEALVAALRGFLFD